MADYSKSDEINLIKAIHDGDENALKAIYSHYYQKLCVYMLNFTTDRSLAEDVVQDTFLKFWDKKATLRIDGSINAYLHKITHNNFIDNYRKAKRWNEEFENFRVASLSQLLDDDNEDLFDQRLLKVKEAITLLPERCREIFLMSKEKGLRYQQIADELGISIKTVENQIGKALQLIRKHVFLVLLAAMISLALASHAIF